MSPDLPVVEPPFEGDRDDARVAGVVLAAGTSSRFGEANKLLATVDGRPLVDHVVGSLLAAGLPDVVVVVGHEGDAVREALSGRPVRTVTNPDYADGQATSLRRGVGAVEDADGALFALGDMPGVSPATVETLVDAFAAGVGDPLAAACDGQRGNPVVFGRDLFDRLRAVEGDTGGRSVLLGEAGARLVETGDPGVVRDVDRPEDL